MILRFRGKEGMFRVETFPEASMNDVLQKLRVQLPGEGGEIALSSTPTGKQETYTPSWESPVANLGLNHGDLLFYTLLNSPMLQKTDSMEKENDELDTALAANSGRIKRDQTQLCTHGPKGMCEYCQPLEPWDAEYQQAQGIKHVSIHAWRKKTAEEGGYLEFPKYSVDSDCRNGHAPWPRGFCSKCQPPAITLQQQRFRMVDHVEFASPKIMENFIEFWRTTSQQRIGFLIGRYEQYEGVPLGIKAEVHAIWEPQQLNDVDSLLLNQLPTSSVRQACQVMGLSVLGVVFTDLQDDGSNSGKVVAKRHLNSYFLSSLEVLFAARMQNEFPHGTNSSRFSSRFVTCCVSGNEFGDIDVSCYQASVQAEAMAVADLIVPSTNPSVMRIRAASETRYVPDIFYKHINEYKLVVQENAKPAFPVDYLLVSLSHGFKQNGVSTPTFTIENRPQLRSQTPAQLVEALGIRSNTLNVECLADFHLVLYLLELSVLQSQDLEVLTLLLHALIAGNSDVAALATAFVNGPGIQTLKLI